MNLKLFSLILMVLLLSGCLEKSDSLNEVCDGNEPYGYEWRDYHQWNTMPMSYGNSTIWQLNNSSTNILKVNLSVEVYFSEPVLLLEQGYFNLSIYENDTLLWTNQTNDDIELSFNVGVTLNETIRLEIRSQGKDTHPESDYGDYFVMNMVAYTYSPLNCWEE